MEWHRSQKELIKGEMIALDGLYYIVMESTQVPNHDNKGDFLNLLQVSGEITKFNKVAS